MAQIDTEHRESQQLTPEGTSVTPVIPPGKSLTLELAGLREDMQALIKAVRALVQLQSVANQKLDAAIQGKPDFGVMGVSLSLNEPSYECKP